MTDHPETGRSVCPTCRTPQGRLSEYIHMTVTVTDKDRFLEVAQEYDMTIARATRNLARIGYWELKKNPELLKELKNQ